MECPQIALNAPHVSFARPGTPRAIASQAAPFGLRMLGCSHHDAALDIRQRLACDAQQVRQAVTALRQQHPQSEAVLVSTCNRVELYLAAGDGLPPSRTQIAEFLAGFHRLDAATVFPQLRERTGRDAVRHLFLVASSLDSMVVGDAQILSQVKQAYTLATEQDAAGPLTHALFQAAFRVARRVAAETQVHHRRVSIPSVAVADFARQIFDRFDDKQTLVIGAGEMAGETLKYLQQEGARRVTIVNRNRQRAEELAAACGGSVAAWDQLLEAVAAADLVISTTGAREPIITRAQFAPLVRRRGARPLFVLDLAVPRDFDATIGAFPNVFLYSLDDLQAACRQNQAQRAQEMPAALRILDDETDRFLHDLHTRAAGPVIQRLRDDWQAVKQAEIQRLFHKLPQLNDHARAEIDRSLERLMNKLLHPPLESLREESRQGLTHGLVESLARLFQLTDRSARGGNLPRGLVPSEAMRNS